MHAGGSGCGCSAAVFNGYLLRGLREGRWKHLLFAPTGALAEPHLLLSGGVHPRHLSCGGTFRRKGRSVSLGLPERISLRRRPLCHRPVSHRPHPTDPCPHPHRLCGGRVLLQAVGVYQYLVDWARAGATVPLTGFGYSLAKGVAKAVAEKGPLGILTAASPLPPAASPQRVCCRAGSHFLQAQGKTLTNTHRGI